jgi:DNA-binding NtrC family response regulator
VLLVASATEDVRWLRSKLEGNDFEVAVATSVRHARELLGAGGIDLLICEPTLPDGNGAELSHDAAAAHVRHVVLRPAE